MNESVIELPFRLSTGGLFYRLMLRLRLVEANRIPSLATHSIVYRANLAAPVGSDRFRRHPGRQQRQHDLCSRLGPTRPLSVRAAPSGFRGLDHRSVYDSYRRVFSSFRYVKNL